MKLYLKDKKYYKVLGITAFNKDMYIATENGVYKSDPQFNNMYLIPLAFDYPDYEAKQ